MEYISTTKERRKEWNELRKNKSIYLEKKRSKEWEEEKGKKGKSRKRNDFRERRWRRGKEKKKKKTGEKERMNEWIGCKLTYFLGRIYSTFITLV